MAATAIQKRQEPVGEEPGVPEGKAARPRTVEMIKWNVKWGEYRNQSRKWEEETNPRLFNLLYYHCTKNFCALLEGRDKWQNTLDKQDGVAMVKSMHAFLHLQDDSRPGM